MNGPVVGVRDALGGAGEGSARAPGLSDRRRDGVVRGATGITAWGGAAAARAAGHEAAAAGTSRGAEPRRQEHRAGPSRDGRNIARGRAATAGTSRGAKTLQQDHGAGWSHCNRSIAGREAATAGTSRGAETLQQDHGAGCAVVCRKCGGRFRSRDAARDASTSNAGLASSQRIAPSAPDSSGFWRSSRRVKAGKRALTRLIDRQRRLGIGCGRGTAGRHSAGLPTVAGRRTNVELAPRAANTAPGTANTPPRAANTAPGAANTARRAACWPLRLACLLFRDATCPPNRSPATQPDPPGRPASPSPRSTASLRARRVQPRAAQKPA
ncbi:hypothetical protein HNR02_006929 [Amycolatopsis endophytica]|uniref:Uncharacterized protein n=1 Tax=Amycolatopsis endophytica TaxID=860233 RepID=A0A853BFP2_9PSEU|nr:hypothetical protein [Amycolatopsis endophytica]